MNTGQAQFFAFIVERVRDEHKDEVKTLMQENFKSQAEGTFTREQMAKTQETLMRFLKPEAVEEVTAAMAHFASQMK